MRDIVDRLNEQMALTPDAYKNVILDAMDEILWLRKEAKMWRMRATHMQPLKATQTASGASSAAEPAADDEVRQTQL